MGYSWIPRPGFRGMIGKNKLTDGSHRSCGQDALWVACMFLGVRVARRSIYEATLPPAGDTPNYVLVNHAYTKLNVRMQSLGWLDRHSGGYALALIREFDVGLFFVSLLVHRSGLKPESHAVLYVSHVMGGVILDNDPGVDVLKVEPEDRVSAAAAYRMWGALFPLADSVRIAAVFHVTSLTE